MMKARYFMKAGHMLLHVLPGLGLSWYYFLLTQGQFFRYFVEKNCQSIPFTKEHFYFLNFCLLWQFLLEAIWVSSNLGPFLLLRELLERMFAGGHIDFELWKNIKFLSWVWNTFFHQETHDFSFLLYVLNIPHGLSIQPSHVSFVTISTFVRQIVRFSLKHFENFLVRMLGIMLSENINLVSRQQRLCWKVMKLNFNANPFVFKTVKKFEC